ncbi:Uncharacterised protein [Metamycoplasma arthritidis]|uniref:Hypothetical membrane protein n=1 Tax=Metamycoplasma arthritidis (strain 158L3-1) TaxID=243272 RepID=B3PN17_META1|nr:hypothetical protein [Metamycoplasma arthritidis]ACF07419.1 hypothetical membrane protein [Metamycoplasma arthritidis 158L3-1]VEU78941.1 Uncharacterised protein [Metamycoplasma arthritidis]
MEAAAKALNTPATWFSAKAPEYYGDKLFNKNLNSGTIFSASFAIISLILMIVAALVLLIGFIRMLVNVTSLKDDGINRKKLGGKIFARALIVFFVLGALGVIFPLVTFFLAK